NKEGEEKVSDPHVQQVMSLAFSSDGLRLASASYDRTVKVWDLQQGSVTHTLTGHADRVTSVAFLPGGGEIVSGSYDRTIRRWRLNGGEEVE
ncbi:hypothetical protein GUITHDRAFT_59617, partial [Guillardia theta CCMP2712]